MSGAGTAAGGRRWLRVMLVLSLGLNLVLGGVIAGSWLRAMEQRGPDRFASRVLKMVPEAHRPAAEAALAEDREAAIALRRELMAASLAALEAFRAEPLDRAALESAIGARQEILTRRRAQRAERVLALAEALPAEARAEFADRLGERLRRRMARLAGAEAE